MTFLSYCLRSFGRGLFWLLELWWLLQRNNIRCVCKVYIWFLDKSKVGMVKSSGRVLLEICPSSKAITCKGCVVDSSFIAGLVGFIQWRAFTRLFWTGNPRVELICFINSCAERREVMSWPSRPILWRWPIWILRELGFARDVFCIIWCLDGYTQEFLYTLYFLQDCRLLFGNDFL